MKLILFLPPLLIFGLAWSGGHGVYLQRQQEVTAIHQQLEEQRRMQALREGVARSLQQAERLRNRLAPELETEWLIRQVSELAQAVGVELSSIVPGTPKTVQEFTQQTVTIQMMTSYHRLGQLLSRVESLPVLVRVEYLDVRSAQDSAAQVRLTLSTLYAPPVVANFTP